MKRFENVVARIEVIDVREGADGCRTDKEAGFLTEIDARADFGVRRQALAVTKGGKNRHINKMGLFVAQKVLFATNFQGSSLPWRSIVQTCCLIK